MPLSSDVSEYIKTGAIVGWKHRRGGFKIVREAVTENYLWLETSTKYLVLAHIKELRIWDGTDDKDDDSTVIEPIASPPEKKPFTNEFRELKLEKISIDSIKLKQYVSRCFDYD